MKKLILLLFVCLLTFQVNAQTSGGPDIYGYTWKKSSHNVNPPVYNWFDITVIGAEVIGLGDDDITAPISIYPSFQYYWSPINQFWIGSNGYISFAGDMIASAFANSVPLPTGANNWIAPFMADLNFAGAANTGKVYYFNNADTLCVSWINVPFWNSSAPGYIGSCTFQVIINKIDKSITFNYKTLSTGLPVTTASDILIGMENNSGNIGLAPIIDSIPTNYSTIKFYYPPVVNYAVTDAGSRWIANERSSAYFVKKQGLTMDLVANVKNYGNQNLSHFAVTNSVLNSSGTVLSAGLDSIPILLAGADTTITFPNTFSAPLAGTYRYRTTVTGIANDMVPTNNSITQEIIAIDTTLTNMYLDYSDGTTEGSLGWNGGNGGVGVYIAPPIYPAKITNSKFYITANATTPVGFYAKIYDDNGLNNSKGTLMDSVYVAPGSFTNGVYTVVPTSSNVVIYDGGCWLLWDMGGNGINIAKDTNAPFSGRTYEVLYNNWSEYRDRLTEDFLMGITVQKYIAPIPPISAFSVDSAADPTIVFHDLSINTPTSYLWNFGDTYSSTVKNPTHIYTSNGPYHVCLKVSNLSGIDSTCVWLNIKNVLPLANFSFTTSAMPTVNFNDLSIGAPTAWKWKFNDGGNDSSFVQNPSFQFSNNGTHSVCLTVTNTAGNSIPTCKTINITGVGIIEIDKNSDFKISPNPISDFGLIDLPKRCEARDISIEGYDLAGKKVDINYTLENNQISLKRANLISGSYYIQIFESGKPIGTIKILVR